MFFGIPFDMPLRFDVQTCARIEPMQIEILGCGSFSFH